MSNANRDAMGRWSSANVSTHTPSDVANAGGSGVNPATDAAPRGAASSISDGSADDWGGPSQTEALLGHSGAGKGSGMGTYSAPKPVIPDYEAGFNKLGFTPVPDAEPGGKPGNDAALRASGYGGNEGPGTHRVFTPGGRPGHGGDVPGSGMPGPADPSDPGGVPGGLGDAADGADVAGAELADLAPLAALA